MSSAGKYAGLSDEELRSRLQGFKFPVPPITASTRAVLVKKLEQFEKSATSFTSETRNNRAKGNGSVGNSRAKTLLDYSSAEEESPSPSPAQSPTARHTAIVKRRGTPTSIRFGVNTRTNDSPASTKTNLKGSRRPVVNGSSGHNTRQATAPAKTFFTYSEGEDDEDSDDDEVDEDDDIDFDDEDDDEEGSDDEDVETHRTDFAGQTSPSLDATDNGGLHYRGGRAAPRQDDSSKFSGRTGRFSSNTPISNTPTSTSPTAYGNFSPRSPGTLDGPSNPFLPPQLRALPGNKEFTSLGEAFAAHSRSAESNNKNHTAGSNNIVTQVSKKHDFASPPPSAPEKQWSKPNKTNGTTSESSPKGFFHSSRVSKLIICVASLFFVYLFFRYTSLRPTLDISQKVPICGISPANVSCVLADKKDQIVEMHRRVVQMLDHAEDEANNSENVTCRGNTNASSVKISFRHVKENLLRVPFPEDGIHLLMLLLRENPKWGIDLFDENENHIERNARNEKVAFLALTKPRLDWWCWVVVKLQAMVGLVTTMSSYLLYFAAASILLFVGYKLMQWRKERQIQEQQEIFELVEQVLSLLMAQHHQALRAQGGLGHRPFGVAVNHIRDQLIPPQERKRKLKIWDKVTKYIQESESRVREDIQKIYGEEHRVWQWIPDLHWPNPFLLGFKPPQHSVANTPSSPPATPMATTNYNGGSPWQGSALGSQSQNMASPNISPTPCLKVRHLFDSQLQQQHNWIWQVKEDVLRRCGHQAKILHVAVDTESVEGCVYVKTTDTNEANKVFRALHGQWYRGNLVTVKYLREERYYERFPDAKFQTVPLKPQSQF